MNIRLALLLPAFLLAAASAQAQINPFRHSQNAPPLVDSDLAMLEQAGQKLLTDEAPAPGASQVWQNDATGAGGTITYVGPTKRKVAGTTYACRKVNYSVTVKTRHTPRTTSVAWCHQADGSWKIN